MKAKLRQKLLDQTQRRYFRHRDTKALNAHFSILVFQPVQKEQKSKLKTAINFITPERAEPVKLTCTPVDDMTNEDKLARKIKVIEL